MKRASRCALALPGVLGCFSAYVFQAGYYSFTSYTTEIVYGAPFHFRFDLWATANTPIRITYYTFATRYEENGKTYIEHEERVGDPRGVLFEVLPGKEHFKLDIEHVCKTPPGKVYYVDLIVRHDGGGSWGFGLKQETGGGLAYHAQKNPYRFLPKSEYHPHRAYYDFAKEMSGKGTYCFDYYYASSSFSPDDTQRLAPFLARFEKRREPEGKTVEFYATEATLLIRRQADLYRGVADYVDPISGDVEFRLESFFYLGQLGLRLLTPRYVDLGTGRMSRTMDRPERQKKTYAVVMPLDTKQKGERFDCEVRMKVDGDWWAFSTSEKNGVNGVARGGEYFILLGEAK